MGVGVGALGRVLCCCILCLSRDRMVWGILLLYAVCVICCHCLSCCSLHSGSMYNLWIRYRYAAILCSSGWLERKLMVVSVEVGLRKMPVLRWAGLLFMERSSKLMVFVDSIVGLGRMLLWMVLMYCSMLFGLVRVEL